MKRILITGADSYIGGSLKNWIESSDDKDCYSIKELDMTNSSWRDYDFSEYDVVFHVAGIAHVKESEDNKDLYYKVNRDLAVETAEFAKESGVKQFILLSSMSVFGLTSGEINNDTPLRPITHYGKAKLEADKKIELLNSPEFKVSILRPPMVYGKGCKGNYQTLSKFAKKFPVFPKYENKRSMIYIDYLCEFVKQLIDLNEEKVCETLQHIYYYPQNEQYVCTADMIRRIAVLNGRKSIQLRLFNPFVKLFANKINLFSKVFGNLTYDMQMSKLEGIDYYTCDFAESVFRTEK